MESSKEEKLTVLKIDGPFGSQRLYKKFTALGCVNGSKDEGSEEKRRSN